MIEPKIYVHCSYIGNTGYNNHTREFFRQLSKYAKLKVRNFTVGSSWVAVFSSRVAVCIEKVTVSIAKVAVYSTRVAV